MRSPESPCAVISSALFSLVKLFLYCLTEISLYVTFCASRSEFEGPCIPAELCKHFLRTWKLIACLISLFFRDKLRTAAQREIITTKITICCYVLAGYLPCVLCALSLSELGAVLWVRARLCAMPGPEPAPLAQNRGPVVPPGASPARRDGHGHRGDGGTRETLRKIQSIKQLAEQTPLLPTSPSPRCLISFFFSVQRLLLLDQSYETLVRVKHFPD